MRKTNSVIQSSIIFLFSLGCSGWISCVDSRSASVRRRVSHAQRGVNLGWCVIKSALKLHWVRVSRTSGIRYYRARCTRDFSVYRYIVFALLAVRIARESENNWRRRDPQSIRSWGKKYVKIKKYIWVKFLNCIIIYTTVRIIIHETLPWKYFWAHWAHKFYPRASEKLSGFISFYGKDDIR